MDTKEKKYESIRHFSKHWDSSQPWIPNSKHLMFKKLNIMKRIGQHDPIVELKLQKLRVKFQNSIDTGLKFF